MFSRLSKTLLPLFLLMLPTLDYNMLSRYYEITLEYEEIFLLPEHYFMLVSKAFL
jgi:hypothetical protein